ACSLKCFSDYRQIICEHASCGSQFANAPTYQNTDWITHAFRTIMVTD
ncbi:MAG: hypothetical protein ACI89J_004315, partial [Hyphomicrobiaceae bacterium]